MDELLAAADMQARDIVFLDHVDAIADDVEASLASVTFTEYQVLRAMLADAVAALRAGLYGPAQAAAVTVLDTVLYHHVLEELDYPDSGKKLATRQHFMPITVDEWEDAVLHEAALVLVGGGLMTAFRTWNRGRGPTSFNRNGSVHHADDGSYSPAHAVRAVLLAHALLRWLDAAVADGQEPAVA